MIKVLINGYMGKMGQEIIKAVQRDPELSIAGKCDVNDDLTDKIQQTQAEVVIDFTHPSVVFSNIKNIIQSNAYGVIGATGLTKDELKIIDKLAKEKDTGIIVAPNFCVGAVLMMQFSAEAAQYIPNIEIVEYHHDEKADAPSGTALKTAQFINEYAGKTNPPKQESKEQLELRSQGAKIENIRIHSVRLPGFLASQEVILGDMGQTLKIRHDTISRESFMPGIILATKKVMAKKGLIYGLENIL